MAILQKINGSKFQSRRYHVPLVDIFHAIQPRKSQTLPPTYDFSQSNSSSTSSDDDWPGIYNNGSDDGGDDDAPIVPPTRHPRSSRTILPPRRQPPRSHNLPARLAGSEWVR